MFENHPHLLTQSFGRFGLGLYTWHPESPEDLQTMANYMSQLNYDPDSIMARLEEERQKFARGLFGLQ